MHNVSEDDNMCKELLELDVGYVSIMMDNTIRWGLELPREETYVVWKVYKYSVSYRSISTAGGRMQCIEGCYRPDRRISITEIDCMFASMPHMDAYIISINKGG